MSMALLSLHHLTVLCSRYYFYPDSSAKETNVERVGYLAQGHAARVHSPPRQCKLRALTTGFHCLICPALGSVPGIWLCNFVAVWHRISVSTPLSVTFLIFRMGVVRVGKMLTQRDSGSSRLTDRAPTLNPKT